MIKLVITMIQSLFVFVSVRPINEPIGSILIFTPNKNIVKPKIIKNAPKRNLSKTLVSSGAKVKFKIKTSITKGKTANKFSFNFLIIMFKISHLSLF